MSGNEAEWMSGNEVDVWERGGGLGTRWMSGNEVEVWEGN